MTWFLMHSKNGTGNNLYFGIGISQITSGYKRFISNITFKQSKNIYGRTLFWCLNNKWLILKCICHKAKNINKGVIIDISHKKVLAPSSIKIQLHSEHVAHAWKKIGLFGEKKSDLCLLSILSNDIHRSNNSDSSFVRTYFRPFNISTMGMMKHIFVKIFLRILFSDWLILPWKA